MTSATHRPALARSLGASVALHALGVVATLWVVAPRVDHEPELVDIEVAPPPPLAEALPAEVAKPPEAARARDDQEPASTQPQAPPDEGEAVIADAGVDAPVDAAPKRRRPDAAADAGVDAAPDAAVDAGIDAQAIEMVAQADAGVGDAEQVATAGSDSGSGAGSSAGSGGVAAATFAGSGSGVPGMTNEPAVAGAPTTAGTAADLLAYFPPGHVIAALVRFDRLRGTEWAAQTERVLRPLPDYHSLFGDRDVKVADKLDTLVIASPRPRDATATTLAVHSARPRTEIAALLANPDAPIEWSAARGGMLGRRSGKLYANDHRVLLSPWKSWFVLAQPVDLGTLVTKVKGRPEASEARGQLPPWLDTLRAIEKESGDDQRGPALVVTVGGPGAQGPKRLDLPELGLGVTSLPIPDRISLAAELVKQGWLVRGNIAFGNEADAAELAAALQTVQRKITGSRVFSALLRRQHLLDIVAGLSIARSGARVSYATSVSIADARALLAATAVTLDQYFGRTP